MFQLFLVEFHQSFRAFKVIYNTSHNWGIWYLNLWCLLQVIALNSSQSAEGELYVDDGKSFEFQRGAYIHRRFIFSDGKLTSLNMAPSGNNGRLFSTECVVERIILLGHPSRPKSALIEPSNKETEIEMGPLRVQRSRIASVLTIRKPNVRVTDDWTIRILWDPVNLLIWWNTISRLHWWCKAHCTKVATCKAMKHLSRIMKWATSALG